MRIVTWVYNYRVMEFAGIFEIILRQGNPKDFYFALRRRPIESVGDRARFL